MEGNIYMYEEGERNNHIEGGRKERAQITVNFLLFRDGTMDILKWQDIILWNNL